ncbi:hypothetical protein SAMN05443287_102197 [Micromonospora phaseoli]|uniref:Uncharacterized protein n=1 Tax=Micromonospora phaseoli TaxID=1144548 RepID=A0A1H6UGT7_9ACTN|nr:hypothetical protein [Micromonospora phaseoli]PZV98961.1 hypothetical protein CLV64_104198 [Micromonospora phaseoli]GIJ76287.1 hypothetical protein Xph01_07190 [Micromonospora phaseoli]SEI89904.1 hypothetical protein SAMN05443287_102197 [Micromonospora phaseoli]
MNVPAQPPYPPSVGAAGASPEGMVLVAVPLAYVPQVARLLADLDARQWAGPVPRRRSAPAAGHPMPAVQWAVEDLRRLSQGSSATHRTVTAVLDALAAEPDRLFTVRDLAQATGRPRKKIVGAMAGLTRLLKAHYDYAGRGLPFVRVAGRPEAPRELCYTMDRVRAERWREARLPRTDGASPAVAAALLPPDSAEHDEERGADERAERRAGDHLAERVVAQPDP